MSDTMHDPGGKSILRIPNGIVGGALITGAKNEHRMWLWRRKESAPLNAPYVLWCGMVPSTAAADVDDMTVRKECGFTFRRNIHNYIKVNVGTYRITDSKALDVMDPSTLVHADNIATISAIAEHAAQVVVACGNLPKPLRGFWSATLSALTLNRKPLLCLGTTSDGWPRHSSRLGYDTPMVEYRT